MGSSLLLRQTVWVCQDNKEEARAIVMRLLQIGVQVLPYVGPYANGLG